MRYVLDSNVALKWVLPEVDDAKAIGIRDEFRRGVHELLAPDVFPIEIASQARIGVYNCLYVALAEREGCALLTADARLVNSLQPIYPFIASLSSLP